MASRWPEVLGRLVAREELNEEQAAWAMGEVLAGNATPAQVAGFAVALRAKGETVGEISALAQSMLENATPIVLDREAVDIVGTGGDRARTVNVSTMAAIVAAAAGAKVVKHGNRAASSSCGTADCLEALGVALDVPPERQAAVLDQVGIVFLFAARYHPSLRHAAVARSELGVPTTFNFLGPLANPARPLAQAVGVADVRMAPLLAGVLAGRGTRGLVFHGADGLDELTTTTTSRVWLMRDRRCVETSLDPVGLGLRAARPEDLVGGDPAHNAQVVKDTFAGASGPVADIVVLNAAAALLAFHGPDLETDLAAQLDAWVSVARHAILSGAAGAKLDAWAAASQAAAGR